MGFFDKLFALWRREVAELSRAVDDGDAAKHLRAPETHAEAPVEQRLANDFRRLNAPLASAQLLALQQKFDNAKKMLERQLSAGELTYLRCSAMINEVYRAALDNLESVDLALHSIACLDAPTIHARLKRQRPAVTAENAALRQRLTLNERQQQRIEALLHNNERALTVLDETAAALASVRFSRGHSAVGLNTALADLERWLQSAGRYRHEE
ncbi:MAG: hypothetical protein ACU837_12150 [Gammaproteobacteria bacterium]